MTARRDVIRIGDFRFEDRERELISQIIESNIISEGRFVAEFESKFASYIGTKYCILVNSGTSAMIAGLTALRHHKKIRLKENSNIITSPVTFIATTNSIYSAGCQPEFVDIDPDTFGITPHTLKAYLENKDNQDNTAGILPVHLMGFPCDMKKINVIAKKYGLFVFEDSAQAHGTLIDGKKAGSQSLLSDFSFYIAHNIQAGELGAITTDDEEVFHLVKQVKAHGRVCNCRVCTRSQGYCPHVAKNPLDMGPRFTHVIHGFNFKTMEFPAALAIAQLERIDQIIERRQENVRILNEGLADLSEHLQLPPFDKNVSYLGYPLVIKNPSKYPRLKVREFLEKNSVETRPLFGCIPTQQPAYSHLKKRYSNKLPNAEYVGSNGFYIGCHQYITPSDLDHIITTFKRFFK